MSDDIRIVDLDTHEPTDAEIISWHEMMTSPDQIRWEYDGAWAKEPTTPEQVVDSFRKRRANQRGENHPFWAIADGKVVGMIGINRQKGAARRHCGEIGMGVTASFTRRGIACRLVCAAIEKARQIGLQRLEADCFADNAPSVALLRKCGFQEEGVRLGAICKDGHLRDQKLFGLML